MKTENSNVEVIEQNNLDNLNDLVMEMARRVMNKDVKGESKDEVIAIAKSVVGLAKVSVNIAKEQRTLAVAKHESIPPASPVPRQLQ